MNLSAEQEEHKNNILNIFKFSKIAYDTSSTGSGKTIVAMKICKYFDVHCIVLGSPILEDNWNRVAKIENMEKYQFLSIFSKNLTLSNDKKSHILIVDECQVLKNCCQKHQKMINLCKHPSVKHILMLSATPFDHPRHVPIINNFIRSIQNDMEFEKIHVGMNFHYPTKIIFNMHHIIFENKEDEQNYERGCSLINVSLSKNSDDISFKPGIFQKGLSLIHEALFSGLLRSLREAIKKQKGYKFIVVLKYMKQFEEIQKVFPDILVINGSIVQKIRTERIRLFQNSNEHQILAITDVIGGVGIDLDDQTGEYKRHIFSLPLFASDFVQLSGRIRRRNSKTDSKITIIQAPRDKTYFKRQMGKKLPILETFNDSLGFTTIPTFTFDHDKECFRMQKMLMKLTIGWAVDHIILFGCICVHRK